MALLLLSMRRHPCRHQNGILSLVTMVLLPLICDGVVTLVMIVLFPSSSWRHCPHCNGAVVFVNFNALIAR
jgi:hypothetical protein